MREIKFRAWDKKYNEMLDDDFILFNGMIYREPRDFEDGRNTNALEIMQFTGLLDKKGVEIYEGDIMTHPEFESGAVQPITITNGCTYIGNWHCIGTNISLGEVIGNIYDNPKLLEQQ